MTGGRFSCHIFYPAFGRVWDHFATPQNSGFCGYGYSCCSVFFYSVCLYAKSVRRFCSEQNRLADRKKSARSGQRVAKQSQIRPNIFLRILKCDRRTVPLSQEKEIAKFRNMSKNIKILGHFIYTFAKFCDIVYLSIF